MATPIDIIYAAHTASCTFLLDSEGICRRIVMAPKGKRRESSRTASRCVGAQYVASLDGSAAGGLVEMPRVGAAMLFARVDERGRVSLVRTGIVTSFESKAAEDPFLDSGTVETSAPDLLTPRVVPTERSAFRGESHDDYYDPSERTQRIQALRPDEIEAALGNPAREHGNDLTTAEYEAASEAAPRTTLPSHAHAQVATLRRPHRETTIVDDDDDDDDEYNKATLAPAPATAAPPPPPPPSRGILPRRSDPKMRAAAAAHAWGPAHETDPRPTPRAYGSDVQVRRRRGG